MTTVAIMQPQYLPRLHYFDLIDQADEFVLLDTVAMSKQSGQTRAQIRARNGKAVWLSIPTHAHLGQVINEVELVSDVKWDSGRHWQRQHARSIESAYSHAPFWNSHMDFVSEYRMARIGSSPTAKRRLGSYTTLMLEAACDALGVRFAYRSASYMDIDSSDPIERLAAICAACGAHEYLSPQGAKPYLEGQDIGVPVRWHEYEHPVYTQGDAPFVSHLSVVDLLAWHGPDSLRIIRGGRR